MNSLISDPYFWTGLSFTAFILLAYYKGKNVVNSALEAKIEEIKKRIEHAEKLRVEAQEMLASYQRKQREATKEAEIIVENAKERATALKKQAEIEIEEIIARREKQMQEKINNMKLSAIDEVKHIATDIAIDAATRAIKEGTDKKTANFLSDLAIEQTANTLQNRYN